MITKIYADPNIQGPMIKGKWGDIGSRHREIVNIQHSMDGWRHGEGGRGGRGQGERGRGGRGRGGRGGERGHIDKIHGDHLVDYSDMIAVDERPPFYDKKEIEKYPSIHSSDIRASYQSVDTYTIALNVLISHHVEHEHVPLSIDHFLDHLARMQILLRDVGCDVEVKRDQLLKYLNSKQWICVYYVKKGLHTVASSISFDPKKRL